MSIRAENIRLIHRTVGEMHLISSPDVPELHVARPDPDSAMKAVQPALDLIHRMKERLAARDAVTELQSERMSA